MKSPQEDNITINNNSLLSTRRGAVILSLSVPVAVLLIKLCFPVIVRAMVLTIPPCFLNYFFDIRCPLCGGTHCAAALARGDIGAAWYYNPLVLTGAAYLGALYLRVAISCFARAYRPVRPLVSGAVFSWAVLIVTVMFVILRNLPFYRAVFY